MQRKLPQPARYRPYYYKTVPGREYRWCACGRSLSQPFCDGSHRGTAFAPMRYLAGPNDTDVLFCACKRTRTPPFCDGSHNNLRDRYEEDDPHSAENRDIPRVTHDNHGRFCLNGACYVARMDRLAKRRHANLTLSDTVGKDTGARFQSQFFLDIATGTSPPMSLGETHAILLVTQGRGHICIGGKDFALAPEMGVYVRPGERFCIDNPSSAPMHLYLSVCPQAAELVFADGIPANFNDGFPHRTVAFDPQLRQRMGDRSFQVLVDRAVGSDLATQFIGDIPLSKAMPHRHLYEETLIVVHGNGCLWTEDLKADVQAGDVIFLPAQQIHSLQCTDPNGMLVAGVIYPGGNPNINF